MAKKLFLLLLVMLPVMAMGQKKYEYVEKQFQKAMKNGKQTNGYYLAEKISRPQYQSTYTEDVASGKSITLKDLKQWAATHGYVLGKYTKVDRYGFVYDPEGVCVNTVYFLPENDPKDISSNTNEVGVGKKEGSTFNNATRIYRKGVWENGKFTGWQINVDKHKRIRVENDVTIGDWEYPGVDESRDVLNEYLDNYLSKEEKEKALAVGKQFITSQGRFIVLSENEVKFENNHNKSIVDFVIPLTVTMFGRTFTVTELRAGAMEYNENMKSVVIPNTVRKIDSSAFTECISLESVVIPNSVETIGSSAFKGCTSLKSVSVSNSLKSIQDFAFLGCSSLVPFALPTSCTEIGKRVFDGCLESYENDCALIDYYFKQLKSGKELHNDEASVLERFVKSYTAEPAKDVNKKLPLAKELITANKMLRALNCKYEHITFWEREKVILGDVFGSNVRWTGYNESVKKALQDGMEAIKMTKSLYGFTQLFQTAAQKLPQKIKEYQKFEKARLDEYKGEVAKNMAEEYLHPTSSLSMTIFEQTLSEDIDQGKRPCPQALEIEKQSEYHYWFIWTNGVAGDLFHDKKGWFFYWDYPKEEHRRHYYKTYDQGLKALYLRLRYSYWAKDGWIGLGV